MIDLGPQIDKLTRDATALVEERFEDPEVLALTVTLVVEDDAGVRAVTASYPEADR